MVKNLRTGQIGSVVQKQEMHLPPQDAAQHRQQAVQQGFTGQGLGLPIQQKGDVDIAVGLHPAFGGRPKKVRGADFDALREDGLHLPGNFRRRGHGGTHLLLISHAFRVLIGC